MEVPPLPRGCIRGGTPIDYSQPICCVNGYVYLDGSPVMSATVTISYGGASITTVTRESVESAHSFYSVSLNDSVLHVPIGGLVTISAFASGQTKTQTFVAQAGSQQIDVVLPSNTVEARWRKGTPRLRSANLVYDQARQHTILVGRPETGISESDSDTWRWDGARWTQLFPATELELPSAASTALVSAAYDAARNKVVWLGPSATWEWDGTTWAKYTPAHLPSALNGGMIYSSALGRVVLFEQRSVNGVPLHRAWTWDGSDWHEQVLDTGPLFFGDTPIVYDTSRNRAVTLVKAQTWEWDNTTWTQRSSATLPPGDQAAYMVYDLQRQRTMILAQSSDASGKSVWQWDGSNWSPVGTYPYLGQSSNVIDYDANANHIVATTVATGYLKTFTVTFDTTTGQYHWSQVWQSDEDYVTINATAFSYERYGSMLMLGNRPGVSDGLTRRWRPSDWVNPNAGVAQPTARRGHRLIRNSDGSKLLTFGGLDPLDQALNDTWMWNGISSTWALITTSPSPPARSDYGLTFDSSRQVWTLFGGRSATGHLLQDTWEFNGTSWTQRTPAPSPPARRNATMTFDSTRGRSVLIGGSNTSGYLNDVWEWDGAQWRDATPAQPISARADHGAAYDTTRKVVVVIGGRNATTTFGDTWEWNGQYWRQRIVAPGVRPRYGFGLDYYEDNNWVVAVGGQGPDTLIQEITGPVADALPIATVNQISPLDARQGANITFQGSGADPDTTDVINNVRWTWLDGPLAPVVSTQLSITLPATTFPVGEHTIRFEVQDNEGNWSVSIDQKILVRDANADLGSNKTWTLLIYAIADNDLQAWLGNYAASEGMLYRLSNAGIQPRVNVAVLYDDKGAGGSRRYEKRTDGDWTETQLAEQRMDDMETLRDFIRWGRDNLPSDHLVVALADHANGVVGFGRDETSDGTGQAFLSPIELRAALRSATDDGTRKIDVLLYDGCSFGLLEDAAIADGLAHFVIASPNTGWAVFPYDAYRQLAGVASGPRDFATKAAVTYTERTKALPQPFTVSVFDMAGFGALNTSVSAFGSALANYITSNPASSDSRRTQISAIRSASQKYDSAADNTYELTNEDAYVDLVDFATNVRASITGGNVSGAADAVLQAATGFIIFEKHESGSMFDPINNQRYNIDLNHAHGLGVFYPPRTTTNPDSAYQLYITDRLFPTTRGSGWTQFLALGLSPSTGTSPPPLSSDRLISLLPPAKSSRVFLPLVRR
jgi:hypothetical protein